MASALARLSPVLHLTRVTSAFAAVGNVWFAILWSSVVDSEPASRMSPFVDQPRWLLLTGGALLGVGLYAFAMALNDTLDHRRDRSLHPERPLVRGAISPDAGVVIAVTALLAGLIGATTLGMPCVLLTLLVAGSILFYTVVARFFPSFGLVLVSLIYGAHMVAPNVYLAFVWPVFLVMTHALLVGGAAHLLADKRPQLALSAKAGAAVGWGFWCAVLLAIGTYRTGSLWPEWVPLQAGLGALTMATLFVVFAWQKIRNAGSGAKAAAKLERYGAWWLSLYGVVWLGAVGAWDEATIMGVLALVGFIGMTALREVYGLIEQPVGFRR